MNRSHVIALLVAVAVGTGCRCDRKSGHAVAKGAGITITAEEFKAKMDEQSPFIRARYTTLERKREFLENLIRFELLVAEARRQKLEKDPEVEEMLKKILVQRLVRKAFDDGAKSAPEGELKKYYDDHRGEFVQPERVRVSQIFIRAERSAPERAGRASDARKVLARLKSEETKNPLAFASVAREVSDDLQTKATGGDLGYRSLDEIARAHGTRVAEAAKSLKNVGDESTIIESDLGFHILKLTARQPALDRPFDAVKEQLASRIGRERRTREFDEFVKKLREKSGIEISDAELDKIPVIGPPSAAPPATPGAPVQPVTAPTSAAAPPQR